ncbi:MAG: DUF456 domain-containing protein [Planctomycetia bacterium]|nr:DUF456 domain-containing protein [Planctomycetia bacterium]
MQTALLYAALWLGVLAALAACWWSTLVGLPGNWLIVLLAVAVAWLVPPEAHLAIGVPVVCVLVGLAIVGEVAEFATGSVATARAGGTRRAALMALVGATVGGLSGAIVGLPIPIVGSAVAAVLFAGAGALVGAMLGEAHAGKGLAGMWQVGQAAFWGRLFGTLTKAALGAVMAIIAAVAATF